MESTEQTQRNLCATGCGFWENPGCLGLCSKCYREHKSREAQTSSLIQMATEAAAPHAEAPTNPTPSISQQPPAPLPAAPTTSHHTQNAAAAPPSLPTEQPEVASAPSAAPTEPPTEPAAEKKKSNRCLCCSKKVGLTGFTCKCGSLFCSAHRQPEDHACPFDYKTQDRAKIQAANQACVAAKLTKI